MGELRRGFLQDAPVEETDDPVGVVGQRLVVGHHDDGRASLELPFDHIGVWPSDQQIEGVAREIEGALLSDEEGSVR